MSLTGALDRFKRSLTRIVDHQIAKAYKLAEPDPKDVEDHFNAAMDTEIAAELTPLIRGFLIANFLRSGVKTQTGQLREALSNAQIWIRRSGTSTRVMIGFKAGMPQKRGKNVYVYGASLNYGAVYQHKPSLLGAKAKRRTKRLIHIIGRQPLSAQHSGGFSRAAQKMKARYIASGSLRAGKGHSTITVTPARMFFHLNPAQEKEVQAVYAALLRAKRQIAAVA